MSSEAKKRKKAYYVQSSKAKKHRPIFQLDCGQKGFLITCNNAEKKAVREAYNVLNDYADAMYGCEKADHEEENDKNEDDFESAIQEEVEALTKQDATERRFQVVETKTNSCVFIKTTLEHPDDLVTKIFTDLCETRKSKSRFILKLFPVLGTCRATEDKIEKLAEDVLSPFLTNVEGLTFCVIYKVRCNNTLGREAIIKLVANVVSRLNPSTKVKFDEPDLVVSVDILQKMCCLSVLKNFDKFRKYNVQEVVNSSKKVEVTQSEEVSDAVIKGSPDAGTAEPEDVLPSESSVEMKDATNQSVTEAATKLQSAEITNDPSSNMELLQSSTELDNPEKQLDG